MEKTLVRGFRILELVAAADRPMGVTEIATALGLGKSAAHRPLATLTQLGYLTHDPDTGRYALSLKLWEVGSQALDRLDLKRLAAAPMAELAHATGETVHLSVLDGREVVHIDKIECQHPIRAYSRVGGRVPAHCVATGKAMLAFQSELVIDGVARRLRRVTPQTVTDRDELLAQLDRIRRTGIAISSGGWQEGVDGIAAPIRDAQGTVVAAVGISGPANRLRESERSRYAPLVRAAADAVSRAFGYRGDAAPESAKRFAT